MPSRIRIETHAEHVREVILDRAAKRNAFDLQMLRELAEAFTHAQDEPSVRVVVLTADGAHFTRPMRINLLRRP